MEKDKYQQLRDLIHELQTQEKCLMIIQTALNFFIYCQSITDSFSNHNISNPERDLMIRQREETISAIAEIKRKIQSLL